jgi:hypothetical protein
MFQPSRINLGLKPLRRDNPWPEFDYGKVEPFFLSLDSGGRSGRELIFDVIKERNIDLMLEVGCFLCGSALQWLRTSDTLTVIGADPWEGNWGSYIESLARDPTRGRNQRTEEEVATIVFNLRRFGNFCIALNNVHEYKSRFIPVRRSAPEVFTYLRNRGIHPQLIYIDADKKREDLDVARKLFPHAILCGDDWAWADQSGALRMQEHVKAFAEEYNYEIKASRQTWLLVSPESGRAKSGNPVSGSA